MTLFAVGAFITLVAVALLFAIGPADAAGPPCPTPGTGSRRAAVSTARPGTSGVACQRPNKKVGGAVTAQQRRRARAKPNTQWFMIGGLAAVPTALALVELDRRNKIGRV